MSSSWPPLRVEVALPLQLPLDPAQRLEVVDAPAGRAPARPAPRRCRRARRPGSPGRASRRARRGRRAPASAPVASPSPSGCVAAHPLAGRPSAGRAGPPAALLQPRHLAGQPGVAHRAGHQLGQLLRAARRTASPSAAAAAAARRASVSTSSSRSAGFSGKNSPYSSMNSVELLLGVLAAGVGVEHLVEVGEHVLDPCMSSGVGARQRVLHPAELAVEHLAAQQVLDLLVRLPAPRPSATGSPPAPAPRAPCRRAARRARASANRAGRPGRGTAPAARPPAPGRAARAPARACRPAGRARRASRAGCAHLAAQVVEPAQPVRVAGRSRPRSASRGRRAGQHVVADLVQRRRTSYGGSSGSGPPCHAPYR